MRGQIGDKFYYEFYHLGSDWADPFGEAGDVRMKFSPGRHLRLVLGPRQLGRQRLGEYDQFTGWGVGYQELRREKLDFFKKAKVTQPLSDSL